MDWWFRQGRIEEASCSLREDVGKRTNNLEFIDSSHIEIGPKVPSDDCPLVITVSQREKVYRFVSNPQEFIIGRDTREDYNSKTDVYFIGEHSSIRTTNSITVSVFTLNRLCVY